MLIVAKLTETVHTDIRALLAEDESFVFPEAATLTDLGLNSLLLARLIVGLEAELGTDPFSTTHAITDVRTVDDLVRAYEEALQAAPHAG